MINALLTSGQGTALVQPVVLVSFGGSVSWAVQYFWVVVAGALQQRVTCFVRGMGRLVRWVSRSGTHKLDSSRCNLRASWCFFLDYVKGCANFILN